MELRTFKTAAFTAALSAVAITALYVVPALAQFTHAAPEDFNNHAGFTSLFDGKTLAGWDGDKSLWSVKDGSIYINPTCEHPTGTVYIVWQGGEVADFDLRVEMKGTGNINSGVQYRSWITTGPEPAARPAGTCPSGQTAAPPPTRASQAKWEMAGYQFDFDNGNRYPGQLYEQSTGRGIIAWKGDVVDIGPDHKTLLASLGDKATVDSWFKKDDWNTEEIIAQGNVLTHVLNGHLISETIDHDKTIGKASGKIGIEVESTGEIFVKNIWLKKN
jgi:hypothetical protein